MYDNSNDNVAKKKPTVQKVARDEMPTIQEESRKNPMYGGATSGQVFRGLDHETLCDKLKETVDMIKDMNQG